MQRIKKLNDGNLIPVIGLGTWKSEKNLVVEAVKFAIDKAGYRHIDCASIYGNEKQIGEALKEVNSINREEIFITSKLWNTDHRPESVEKACRKSLSDLRLEYLDLYLMHWGIAFKPGRDLEPLDKEGKVITDPISIQETWKAMELLVEKGLVKSIGVANFTTIMLIDLLSYASIKPVMNQIELHPYNTQTELIDFCRYKNITVTAYSPLAHEGKKLFDEPVIKKLSNKYGKTPAQILLNWAIGRGTIPIPKSITMQRIKENINVFDFELKEGEVSEIDLLNKNHRVVNPVEWWGIPYFA